MQDEGLGSIPDGEEDWNSVGSRLLMTQAADSPSYVKTDSELTFTGHDGTNDTVDVTAGVAFLDLSGVTVTVQSGKGGSSPPPYDVTLPEGPNVPVVVPNGETDIPLQDSTLSAVWLAYATDGAVSDVSPGDVYLRSDDTGSVTAPPHPSVKLGEANPDNAGADTLANRYAEVVRQSVQTDNGYLNEQASAPSVPTGQRGLYADDDGNIYQVNPDGSTTALNQSGSGGGSFTSTSLSLSFGTWTTVDANNRSYVQLNLTAKTDGTDSGLITTEVDESGGTTADYSFPRCKASPNAGAGYVEEEYAALPLPAGAQIRVTNDSDPNNINNIRNARAIIIS